MQRQDTACTFEQTSDGRKGALFPGSKLALRAHLAFGAEKTQVANDRAIVRAPYVEMVGLAFLEPIDSVAVAESAVRSSSRDVHG